MTTAAITTNPTETTATTRRDRIAQVILGLCAVGAGFATATAIGDVADAEGTARLAETWRLFGLPVFAGLFIILAVAPRRVSGLWELVIANKIALVVAGATFLSGVEGSSDFVYVDGILVVLLVAAYVLTRGWTAWSNR
ncbi:MAG: hypothetical protein ACR2QO_01315 [Acidimicrobiales bacterium]